MDIAGRVRMKSDRKARALIIALCLAPVAAPFLAVGANALLKPAVADAPALAPAPAAGEPLSRLSLRAAADDAVFSSAPLGDLARLDGPPPAIAKPASRPAALGSQVLRNVRILEDFQLESDGIVVTLDGIGAPPQGSECRRLDGVVEPCAVRALNRLEVLTRGRPVACDLRQADDGRVRGLCRAGKIDLADDLVRNGLAVRAGDRP